MFESSSTTDLLDVAFAKAQGEFGNATKNAVNPHFRSKYADLAAIWDVVREPLAKYDLHVSQWLLETTDGRVRILTRISHKGQYMQATSSVPVSKQDAQGSGSAATYGKRYALAAALGIATEDDDGNAASEKPSVAAIPPGPSAKVVSSSFAAAQIKRELSEAQIKRIFAMSRAQGWEEGTLKQLLKVMSKGTVASFKDLSKDQYDKFCTEISTHTPSEALESQA